jgi:lysophospholipase L1-like esterase
VLGGSDFRLLDINFANKTWSNGTDYWKPGFVIKITGFVNIPQQIANIINSSANVLTDIVLSNTTKHIKLLGDSITQGSRSTGYIEFNKVYDGDEYTVMGNSPDYPDAGAGYVVGDYLGENSKTKWYEAINGSGWAQLMKAYFESKFNCVVKNYGMGTAKISDIYSRKETLISDTDDIIFLMIGTNDRWYSTPTEYYNNLNQLVDYIIGLGKKLILMSANPIANRWEDGTYHFPINNFHMEDINNIVAKVASEHRLPFVSLYNMITEYSLYRNIDVLTLLADGFNPNDTGYNLMFNFILEHFHIANKRAGANW